MVNHSCIGPPRICFKSLLLIMRTFFLSDICHPHVVSMTSRVVVVISYSKCNHLQRCCILLFATPYELHSHEIFPSPAVYHVVNNIPRLFTTFIYILLSLYIIIYCVYICIHLFSLFHYFYIHASCVVVLFVSRLTLALTLSNKNTLDI